MSRTSRRTFAKTAAAAGAALPFVAFGQTPPPVIKPEERPSALAHAQTEVVNAEYGQYVTYEELAGIAKDFQESAPFLQRLRDFKLKNSDEPDFTFSSLVRR